MKIIGFIISHMNGEKRRAVLPNDIKRNVRNPQQLYFERRVWRVYKYSR